MDADLQSLQEYKIPCCYSHFDKIITVELHMFSDASEAVYAAVGYWRYVYLNKKIVVSFIMGKSHVAPLKPQSIPRMKLQAARIASRLAKTICDEHNFRLWKRVFWTDSTTVLHWIQSNPFNYKHSYPVDYTKLMNLPMKISGGGYLFFKIYQMQRLEI